MSTYATTGSEQAAQASLLAITSSGALANVLLLIACLRTAAVRRVPLHALKLCMASSDLLVQVTVAFSTAVSLSTSLAPDARPLACQVQAALTLFGALQGFCVMIAVAISRYLVIVRNQELTRRDYGWMIVVCTVLSSCNVICLIIRPAIASSNQGRLICLTQWADMADSVQMYITVSNLVLWHAATAVAFACYSACFNYVEECNQPLRGEQVAVWKTSPEINQCKRLYYLTMLSGAFYGIAGVIMYSAITQKQAPPVVDQISVISIGLLYIGHSVAVLWLNGLFRQAFVALLCCRRHSKVRPGRRLSTQLSMTVVEIFADETPKPQRDASRTLRKHMSDERSSTTNGLLSPPRVSTAGGRQHGSLRSSVTLFSSQRSVGSLASIHLHHEMTPVCLTAVQSALRASEPPQRLCRVDTD